MQHEKWTQQVLAESTPDTPIADTRNADTRNADTRPGYVRRFWNKRERRAANA